MRVDISKSCQHDSHGSHGVIKYVLVGVIVLFVISVPVCISAVIRKCHNAHHYAAKKDVPRDYMFYTMPRVDANQCMHTGEERRAQKTTTRNKGGVKIAEPPALRDKSKFVSAVHRVQKASSWHGLAKEQLHHTGGGGSAACREEKDMSDKLMSLRYRVEDVLELPYIPVPLPRPLVAASQKAAGYIDRLSYV